MRFNVTSYWGLQSALNEIRPDGVISIMDAAHLVPDLGLDPSCHLRLGFHDIEVPEAGKVPPSPASIEELVEFARRQRTRGARSILIHCMAGVRRSPAAAYVLAVSVRHEDPVRAAHVLFREAPFADPNMLMVNHAEAAMSLMGSMTAALREARKSIKATSQQHFFSI
jgi:predicted protein tyrosine phosphatase